MLFTRTTAFIVVSCLLTAFGQTLFIARPQSFQLFQRGPGDSAVVIISGEFSGTVVDSIRLSVTRDGAAWKQIAKPLTFSGGKASFSLTPAIAAGLHEYSFSLVCGTTPVLSADSVVCGDAYLISGQSNGMADDLHTEGLASRRDEWVRSFGYSGESGVLCPLDTTWGMALASNYFTGSSHLGIGAWGFEMGHRVAERDSMPIAIINGSMSGTYLYQHARNITNPLAITTIYGRLLWRAEKAGLRNNVKSLFWLQGESDSYIGTPAYTTDFGVLYSGWKSDYPALQRIYLLQVRPSNCGGPHYQPILEAHRELGETYADIRMMSTNDLPFHDGCHYFSQGYYALAGRLVRLVEKDWFGAADTSSIYPPNITSAEYSLDKRRITLQFNQPAIWPQDTLGRSVAAVFYLDSVANLADSGFADASGNIVLRLRAPGTAQWISYLPAMGTYAGPFIRNNQGIGALGFHRIPLSNGTALEGKEKDAKYSGPLDLRISPNPFNSGLQISAHGVTGSGRVTVYDLLGKKIAEWDITSTASGNPSAIWNSGHLPGGIYVVRLADGNRFVERKCVRLK